MSEKRSSSKNRINKGRKNNFYSMFGEYPAPVWVHDRETLAFLEMNRAAFSLLEYKKNDLKKLTLAGIFPEDEVPLLYSDLNLPRKKGHFSTGWHLRSKRGQLINVDLTTSPIDYDSRKAVLVIASSERSRTIERRILEARLRISEFAHAHSLDELLRKTLDEAELLTDSNIGFFHFVEKDQKNLSLQNWSTNTLKNMCTADGKWSHYAIDQAGVWVDCARQRRPVIYNDYASLKHRKGMPAGHAAVTRLLTIPVMRGDDVVAILGVGNKPVEYAESDVATVNLLADLAWDITGRMRAEQQSRAAEENYRAIFENATVGIFQSTPDGVFRKVNPEMARIFGYASADEMIASVVDIPRQIYANAASRDRFINPLNGNNEVFNFVEQNLRKDGSVIWTFTNARTVRNETGGIQYYEGFLQEVTRIKQMEDALRQNEARLGQLFDKISNVAVQGYGPDGTVRLWNEASEKIYGYTKAEAMGRNLLDLIIPPEMKSGVKVAIREMIESGQSIPPEELSLMRKDGTRVPVYSNHTIIDTPGVGKELYCIDIDLTERKRFEEALRDSEEKYRQLFDSESDAIFLIDNETGRIQEANSAASRTYGYSHEEFLGLYNFELSAEPDSTRKAMRERETRIPIRWHKKKNDTIFPVEISASHLMWNGRAVHIAAIRDITERKQTEDALQESEVQYRIMFQNNPHPMWVYDRETLAFLEVNDAAITHYGYSLEEFMQMTISDIHPVEEIADLQKHLLNVTAQA